MQGRGLDGLDDDRADAGVLPAGIARHVVTGDRRREDRGEFCRAFAQAGREVEPVHPRHQHVEDRDVERALLERGEAFLAGRRGGRLDSPSGQERGHQQEVRRVVVDDEGSAPRERSVPAQRGRRHVRHARLERHVERAALAGDATALGRHGPAHQLGEPAADRESEARPAEPAAGRRVDLRERLEESIDPIGGDPDPGVADRHVERDAVPLGRLGLLDVDGDLALVGELHRVVQQVQQDLAEPARVAYRGLRRPGLDPVGRPRDPCAARSVRSGPRPPRRIRGRRTGRARGPSVRPRSWRSRGCR